MRQEGENEEDEGGRRKEEAGEHEAGKPQGITRLGSQNKQERWPAFPFTTPRQKIDTTSTLILFTFSHSFLSSLLVSPPLFSSYLFCRSPFIFLLFCFLLLIYLFFLLPSLTQQHEGSITNSTLLFFFFFNFSFPLLISFLPCVHHVCFLVFSSFSFFSDSYFSLSLLFYLFCCLVFLYLISPTLISLIFVVFSS